MKKMMIGRKTMLVGAGIAAAASLGISATLGYHHHGGERGSTTSAAWKDTYQTVGDLVRDVDVIAVADAVRSTSGRMAYSDGGEDSLPFEVVEFDVSEAVKGTTDGGRLEVERVGGLDAEGVSVYFDSDGGAFEPGGRYLLFLKKQEEGGYYYQVNDQGRYRVVVGRLRTALDPAAVIAQAFHGRPLEEGLALIRRELKAE